jgi:3-deoxy-D-manno-octulosonate 8-phosphate phosphatase KdsC-like HAD superfamily phosphatase
MYIYSGFLTDTNTVKVAITPIMGTGNARIYSNATIGGYKPFCIRSTVGVKELDKSEIVDVKYYDIYGKEKSLTEAKGLTIKITTFSNGYAKKEKVIIQSL